MIEASVRGGISYTVRNCTAARIYLDKGQRKTRTIEREASTGAWKALTLAMLPETPLAPGTPPYDALERGLEMRFHRTAQFSIEDGELVALASGRYRLVVRYRRAPTTPRDDLARSTAFSLD